MAKRDKNCMLSTIDNPFNPFTQFEEWWLYDELNGHHCCGLLGSYANTSPDLTNELNEEEIENAMDSIIKDDPLNIYIKVYEDSKINPIQT